MHTTAEPGSTSPPSWLLLAGHGLYAYAALLGIRGALAFSGRAPAVGGDALDGILVLPAIGLGLLFFVLRNVPRDAGFVVSHVAWVTLTLCTIAILAALTGLLLVVTVLSAAVFRPAAPLINAPWVIAPVAGLWYAYRLGRGYVGYLRGRPVP